MQYYYNQYPNAINDLQITQICNDDNSMNGGFKFSSSGCVMTACANAAQQGDTYVLARTCADFDGDGKKEYHWVVLEGYTTDDKGRMIFSYDGTSDNDAKYNRVYVYGDPKSNNEFKIDKIETFRITSK